MGFNSGFKGLKNLLPSVSIETSFVTVGSRFTGIRRLPLRLAVNYDQLMLYPHILEIKSTRLLSPLPIDHRLFKT